MAPGTIGLVPNQPKTPNRTMRIPDVEWDAWRAAAAEAGMTVTDYVRDAVNNKVKRQARRSGA